MSPVRWGIIGCGDVTEVKSGPAFAKAEGSALVAVMRRTAHLAEDYARRHGVPRWYADAEALVRDPDVDAVYVATPPDGHLDGVRLAARHGKPVYVEKPMARTHEECLAMIEACRAGRRAAVHRVLPAHAAAVPEGEGAGGRRRGSDRCAFGVDPPESTARADVAARCRGGSIRRSPAADCSSISRPIRWICSTTSSVRSPRPHGGAANQGGFYAAEDIVTASLAFASGARGTGLWCFTADHDEDVVEIIGSDRPA